MLKRALITAVLIATLGACGSMDTAPTKSQETRPEQPQREPSMRTQIRIYAADIGDSELNAMLDALDDVTAAAEAEDPDAMLSACLDGLVAIDDARPVLLPTPDDELTYLLGQAIDYFEDGYTACVEADYESAAEDISNAGDYMEDATDRLGTLMGD